MIGDVLMVFQDLEGSHSSTIMVAATAEPTTCSKGLHREQQRAPHNSVSYTHLTLPTNREV